jgi:hypothetical protein
MKRFALLLGAALTLAALSAPLASASFGLKGLNVGFEEGDGTPATLAGAHPFALATDLEVETRVDPEIGLVPDGMVKDLRIEFPAGMVGNPTAVPQCSSADFARIVGGAPDCSNASAIGVTKVGVALGASPPSTFRVALFNLIPPPGAPSKVGFAVLGVPVTGVLGVKPDPPYNIVANFTNTSQAVRFYSSEVLVWGNPASAEHDADRNHCATSSVADTCPVVLPEKPFLTMPRSCEGPLVSRFSADSWQQPGDFVSYLAQSPFEIDACSNLGFAPEISSAPTTRQAGSPSGLAFTIDVDDPGLTSPSGIAKSDIKKAVVTLPEGVTVNPSIAEGLATCSEAELAQMTAFSAPGEGCPQASKVGEVEVETPLLEGKLLRGSIFIASQEQNPFHSLLALYMVIQDPGMGIFARLPGRVDPDPRTGQLTTTFGEPSYELPQIPISHFRFRFREGARAPLATPSHCGSFQTKAVFTPWANPTAPYTTTASFSLDRGAGGGACPGDGPPPFRPGLTAGTLNNAAGSFSPFNVKLTRSDAEQEFTNFSIKLPPGIAAKLAGIPSCSDAGIARAASRTGPHGGAEEIADPSCPAASQVGRTLAGSGVGQVLAYAPGKIYLAGPYHGAPISFVSITSGVVGPFDIGTVVVRLAVKVNPETGEVFLDSTGSDPIPHIIQGIAVHLRDIRAYTDRPQFTFNPTSCKPTSTAATVLGSGLDFVSAADDNPFVSTSPFQAADCAALPFEPKLALRLSGGTKRGDFPKLKAFLRMRGFGEAGVAMAQVTLPRSEFIANAHFNTICTRVQFKAAGGNGEACPAGSIYGWARAKTPILADPLEGPVFLRSSEHQLPDVVASLRGQQINVHLVGHVDSVKGQLRNTFESVPDAPVEWASFSFKGGKKGLFENSTNLCLQKNRADVRFSGQNGKTHNYRPAIKVKCAGKAKKTATHKRAGR